MLAAIQLKVYLCAGPVLYTSVVSFTFVGPFICIGPFALVWVAL